MTQFEQTTRAAALLSQAELGAPLPHLPPELAPATEDQAYAIQEAVLASDGIAGWKVAAIQVPRPLTYAMIAQARVLHGQLPPRLTRPEIEVEIALCIARDLPPRAAPYSEDEVNEALGTAHAAIEVITSRYLDRKAVPPLSALADALSCSGLVTGGGTTDWRGLDFMALEVKLDGAQPLAKASGNATVAQTLTALTALANHASRRGLGLKAGQFVITGARIGPLPVVSGQELTASVQGIGQVILRV